MSRAEGSQGGSLFAYKLMNFNPLWWTVEPQEHSHGLWNEIYEGGGKKFTEITQLHLQKVSSRFLSSRFLEKDVLEKLILCFFIK